MVARPFSCDRSRLRLLLEDRLDESDQAELSRHLESCASCREGLEDLAAESRWWGDARLLADEVAPTGSPDTCQVEPSRLAFLEPTEEPGRIGKLGIYEVVEVIGRGGMGVVLKAFDPPLNRFVAIKVLAPELATSATARRRFAREAQAVAAIAHDHIVSIHAVDATPCGLPYIVMQYVSGKSLQERIDRSGPLEVREVLRIGMQAASGLAAAHALGLVHRDVKPANILLENCVERVKLTDFGLARAADDASLTQSGVVAGTPQYMAPEQARGEPVDARSDLFSLGSVLYTLCTGRSPFRAETTMGVLRRVSEDRPRPIRETNPEVPDWLAAIVEKLHAKDPADRFASAAEVASLLGRCMAYLEQPGQQPPPFVAASAPTTRRKVRGWMVGVAALAVFAVGLGAARAYGVSDLADLVATVLRIKTPEGTLVIKVEDPEVKVRVDGEDVVISGAGPEVRLTKRTGTHLVEKSKGGVTREEIVTITRGGQRMVTASLESDSPPGAAGGDRPADPFDQLRSARDELNRLEHDQLTAAKVKQLQDRIKELEAQVPVWHPIDPRAQALDAARQRLKEVRRTTRDPQHDPAARKLEREIVRLENELRQNPFQGSGTVFISPGGFVPGSIDGSLAYPVQPGATGMMRMMMGARSPVRRREAGAGPVAVSRALMLSPLIETPTAAFSVALSPAGGTLAVACQDGSIRLWDLGTGKQCGLLRGHKHEVRCVAFSPDGRLLASAGGDWFHQDEPGELKLWDVDGQTVVRDLRGHSGLVWSVAFSPDGRTLASGSADKTARLWDVATGTTRVVLEGHKDAVRVVSFAPAVAGPMYSEATTTLVTAGFDGVLKFWHNAPGQKFDGSLWLSYPTFSDGANGIAISPDGRLLAVCPRPAEGKVRPDEIVLINSTTWKECARLKGHRNAVLTVAFSPDGKTLASGGGFGEDPRDGEGAGEVLLWDVATARMTSRFNRLQYRVESLAFTPDGKALISGGGAYEIGGEVRFWDPALRPAIRPESTMSKLQGQRIWSLAYSPDGRSLAIGSAIHDPSVAWFSDDRGAVNIYRKDRDALTGLAETDRYIREVAFSPDGKLLATAEIDNTAKLRDPDSGQVLQTIKGHTQGVNGVAFTPDGKTLATAGLDGVVMLWDVRAPGQDVLLLRTLKGHEGSVYSVAISPDGRTVASGGEDDTVRLWDLETGRAKSVHLNHWNDVETVRFSPDGKLLVSASWDLSVKLWDVASGNELATLSGHSEPVLGAAFSPDGKTLATCGGTWGVLNPGPGRGEVILWDVATRTRLTGLDEHTDRVLAVEFSPDGKTLATGGWDGIVRFWDPGKAKPNRPAQGGN